MLLSTFNPTQISNAVWVAAARTLTADPATNLGAAKLVWDRTTVAPAAGGFGALVNLNLDAKVSLTAFAATALSTAVWTNGRGANLDNLDATVSTRAFQPTTVEVLDDNLNSGTGGSFSAWQQELASSAGIAYRVEITGSLLNGAAATAAVVVEFGVGAGGSEVTKCRWRGQVDSSTLGGNVAFTMSALVKVATASRFAIRAKSDQVTATSVTYGINISEA